MPVSEIEQATCVHCLCRIVDKSSVPEKYTKAAERILTLQKIITDNLERSDELLLSSPAPIAKTTRRYTVFISSIVDKDSMHPKDRNTGIEGPYVFDVPPGKSLEDMVRAEIPMAVPEHFKITWTSR